MAKAKLVCKTKAKSNAQNTLGTAPTTGQTGIPGDEPDHTTPDDSPPVFGASHPTETDSQSDPTAGQTERTSQDHAPTSDTPLVDTTANAGRQGDVTLRSAATGPLATEATANPPREESQADATRRWRATGVAEQVAVYRDRMREEYRANHPKAKRREAHDYAWACALAAFPPPGVAPQSLEEEPETLEIPAPEQEPVIEPETSPAADKPAADSLVFTVPPAWPELPDNASLQAEIAWVSANRLRVRDGSGVDLSRAKTPAPSYSALSWLETSILFPSKFADISVKATANQDDEKEAIRREKASIEEVRAILKEMLED